jgi:hypothetical protein
VWLDGEYVDPFAAPGETSLWLDGNEPIGKDRADSTDAAATDWDEAAVGAAIEACVDERLRAQLSREPAVDRRAMNVLFARNYYPTKFTESPPLYAVASQRAPRLSLPFRSEDFAGIVFP